MYTVFFIANVMVTFFVFRLLEGEIQNHDATDTFLKPSCSRRRREKKESEKKEWDKHRQKQSPQDVADPRETTHAGGRRCPRPFEPAVCKVAVCDSVGMRGVGCAVG